MSPSGRRSKVVDSLRIEAQVWLNAVRLYTGFGYLRLVRAFSEIPAGKKLSVEEARTLSTTWKRYASGKRVPNPSTIRRVDESYPGTSAWLALPLWAALSPSDLTLPDLRRIHDQLRPEVRTMFFHNENAFNSQLFKNASHRKPVSRATLDRLGALGLQSLEMQPPDVRLYLDALTCAVVVAREARLTENDNLHFCALRAEGLLVDALGKIPEIAPFKDQVIKRILEVRGPAVYILP
jgi:hypothetical protein